MKKPHDMKEINNPKIIVALDCASQAEALALAQQLDPALCRVKVGKELFTAAGPAIIDALHQLGFQIFLDLKFHDIPNTVAKACQAAARLGVWMLSLHASGGARMLRAAQEAVNQCESAPLLVGVTVLTSFTAEELVEVGVIRSLPDQVLYLAQLAKDAGLAGLVCSVEEVENLRVCFPSLLLVTPGIRLSQDASDDQRRIATPSAAIQKGADYLVIGRPITRAENPLMAIKMITNEIK